YYGPFLSGPQWMYSGFLGGYTFFPGQYYTSIYGYRFYPMPDGWRPSNQTDSSGGWNNSNQNNSSNNSTTLSSAVVGASSRPSSSGGGSSGGAGGSGGISSGRVATGHSGQSSGGHR